MDNNISIQEGIVIKRKNFGETDKIITVFTRNQGKIRLIAKGIRKISSRRASHIELFKHVKITYNKFKALFVLTDALSMDEYNFSDKNLNKLAYAYYLSEIIDQLVPESQPMEDIFELFKKSLKEISQLEYTKDLDKQFPYLASGIMATLGYLPQNTVVTLPNLVNLVEDLSERRLKTPKLLLHLAS